MAAKMATKYINAYISGHILDRTKNEGSSFTYRRSRNRLVSFSILYHNQNPRWPPKCSQNTYKLISLATVLLE